MEWVGKLQGQWQQGQGERAGSVGRCEEMGMVTLEEEKGTG